MFEIESQLNLTHRPSGATLHKLYSPTSNHIDLSTLTLEQSPAHNSIAVLFDKESF